MNAERPIGVFDSGLGGLTVAAQLIKLLPDEDIVYFGDTARVPYGTKTDGAIIRYSRSDCAFLMTKDVKAIVIACHTVSSVAGELLKAECPLPVFGVAQVSARAAAAATRSGRIGVIGTQATIRSHCHRRCLLAIDPGYEVIEAACPLFVPLVENGFTDKNDPVVREAAKAQLAPMIAARPDTLILGCTHFPLLSGIIAELLPNTELIDPGRAAAVQVRGALAAAGGLNPAGGKLACFVSDEPADFERFSARALGGRRADSCEKIDIEVFEK